MQKFKLSFMFSNWPLSTSEHLGKELNSYKKYFDHEPGS